MDTNLFLKRQAVSSGKSFLAGLYRNLLRLFRNKASLVSLFVIPGFMMSGFLAVFGHAAREFGFDYSLYLMAGSMFQAAMFSAGGSVMAIAVDLENGILDRSLTMPVSIGNILASRLTCDLVRTILSVLTVIVIAYLWGARAQSLLGIFLAFILALIIGEVLSLVFMALSLPNSRPVQVAGIIQGIEMMFLMASTAFLPVETMPKYFSAIVKHQPFSPLIDTLRALIIGQNPSNRGLVAIGWLIVGSLISLVVLHRTFSRRKG